MTKLLPGTRLLCKEDPTHIIIVIKDYDKKGIFRYKLLSNNYTGYVKETELSKKTLLELYTIDYFTKDLEDLLK